MRNSGAMEGTAGAAPPGWYANPEQPDQLRWWDGQAWTDHTAQKEQPPAPALTEPSDPLAGLGRGLKKATETELADGEVVLGAWRAGMPTSAEAVVCTDKRVIVIKRDASMSRQVNSYLYTHIGSVHVTKGSRSPLASSSTELQLSVPGVQVQASAQSQLDWTGTGAGADRMFAPNTVNFGWTKTRKAAAAEAAQMIQALIERAAAGRETAANTDKACPRCAETIKGAALVCRYCGHHL